MEQEKRDYLEEQGFEIAETLNRFVQNEALYFKCVKKYPEDQNLLKLREAYEAGNVKEAFAAAHTLKGMSANLGIVKIYKQMNSIVETLREGNLPKQEEIAALETAYHEVCAVIEKL